MTAEHIREWFFTLLYILFLIAFIINTQTYPALGKIVEVNRENNSVCFETDSGNLYEFSGTEDWEPGDFCVAIMGNRLTEEVEDDFVLDAKFVKIDMFAD